ncbi:hypothetical protein Bbelb_397240 [Branchiostoma belcheri]|nr:hypothetical protein Bbelb_397240 [Branchiostoma belcheri]
MATARSLDNHYGNSNKEDQPAVLLVIDKYSTSHSGNSSLNREVGKTVKEHVPDIPVYSMVLQATEEDKQDAQQDRVELLPATLKPDDPRTDPSPDWLTFDHQSKYSNLPPEIRSIVGYSEVTSRAAVRIRQERYSKSNATVILFTTDIPEDTEYYKGDEKAMGIGKKEDSILEDAQEADVVFSLGKKIFDHFENQFRAIPASKRPRHVKFVPRPSKIFEDAEVEYKDTETMVVLSIGRVKGVEKLKGYDLAAETLSIVAEKIKIKWHVIGFNKDDFEATKAILGYCKSANLQVTFLPYGTQKDICKEMMKAHLVLMPSRAEPFGLVGLEAIAVGVPVLVSSKSGLADFIHEHVDELHHSIVDMDGSDEGVTVKLLAQSIERMLKHNRAEFKTAARGKQQLLSTKYWEEFHLQFINACTDTGAQHPSEVQMESAAAPVEANRIREPLVPGNGTQQTGQVQHRKRDAGAVEEALEKVPGPPKLPIVVEILAQVLPSIKTPVQLLSYASAKAALVTIDITKDETLLLLKQIMPEIKTIEDLVNTTEAVRQLSNIEGVSVTGTKTRSLVFYLQCTDMSGLGQLWFMYKCGKLNDLLAGSLVSEETLRLLYAESISVKTTINIEDFRKALVYLLSTVTSSAEGQPIPRLPQEYPLYQPHPHTTTSVLDVLHLDGTNLTRSSEKQQELHILPTMQTENSQDHRQPKPDNLQAAGAIVTQAPAKGDQHRSTGVQVEQVTSQLALLHTSIQPKDVQRLRAGSILSTASTDSAASLLSTRTTHSTGTSQSADTGYVTAAASILSGDDRPSSAFKIRDDEDPQVNLNLLLAELNTPAVKGNKAQQLDLYCQIGDLHRTKLHNLQSALQYYQNMLECSQELTENNKKAKAYNRLGLTYGQVSDAKSNYESALAVAMETGNKTEQMDIYCKLGDLHWEQLHEPQESHKYYTEMLALARDLGRKEEEGLAYNRLGAVHYVMGEHEESLEWDKKGLKMSQESGDKTGQITAHQNIADSYKALGKVDLARSHYQSAMTIAMETGNKTEQMDIYCELGDLHRKQLHEPQESHKYYTEMLALARDLGRKDRESQAYNRLGRAHYDLGEHEESLEWHKKDLKMSQESGDKTEQITAHQNIADSYKALGKLDLARSHYQSAMTIAMETGNKTQQMDIYCKLGDLHRVQLHEPQESHKYYTEMLALARDLGRKDREGLAYNRLGHAHYDMGEHEESLEWSKKTLKMRQESGDKTQQIIAHQNIAVSYKALGKLDLARSHYQSAMTIAMETGNKTEQMDIYCKLGDLHREQLHEPQESHKYYTEMLALARDLGRKDKESQAYNRLGRAHYDMGEHEESLEWDKKDLKMRQESGDKTEQITADKNIAVNYKALGKLDLVRSHYQSAMTIAMETGNKQEQEDIAKKLANL